MAQFISNCRFSYNAQVGLIRATRQNAELA